MVDSDPTTDRGDRRTTPASTPMAAPLPRTRPAAQRRFGGRVSTLGKTAVASFLASILLVPAGAAQAANPPIDSARGPGHGPPAAADPGRGPGHVPPERAELQHALDAVVEAGAAGAAVEVRDQHGAWRGTSGVAEIDSNRPILPHSRFRVGSITKTFMATIALQLTGEGKLALDAPVERYLPGIIPGDQDITVRMIMNHTSGLFNYTTDPKFATTFLRNRQRTFAPEELVRIAMQHEPEYDPAPDEPSYSNTNYVLLGMLIEKVTGNDIRSELHERVLRPAGLRHTRFPEHFPFIKGPNAHGYLGLQGPSEPLTDVTRFNPSWAWTAGAITSTTSDLNRFYRALLTGELLAPEPLEEMQATTPLNSGLPYGLGLTRIPMCGTTLWGHDGRFPGFITLSFTSADGQRQVSLSLTETTENAAELARVSSAAVDVLATEFCGRTATSQSATPSTQDHPGTAPLPHRNSLPAVP
ncbi:serine hydrolase domain-containing protein [Haloactinomyces albus]|uniref:D-alanyl-D-alanine carboxypeptidase n=1 Tax=Haloactinomyces albus TaxID=1352928 RepID=A0AAE4CM12_9ACTN|nr:serine hydrolase [Haloactinomyces albus]MDR7301916.1 D-alanyl-D-alanine carboxypeptidase [Haloactinomyces albus]